MRTSRLLAGFVAAAVALVALPACGDDDELDEVRAQLAAVSAERDSLRSELETEYVVPDAVEPTERQIEMVEVVGQFLEAWNAQDAELAASLMTVDATVEDIGGWFALSVENGALVNPSRDDFDAMAMSPLEVSEPMLIAGDHVAVAVSLPSELETRPWVFRFLTTGAAKISHVRMFL